MSFASLYSPRMAVCGVSDDRIKSFEISQSFPKTFNMSTVKKNMYRSFFPSVTKRARGSICYSKSVQFILRKKYVIKNVILKRTQGSVNSCLKMVYLLCVRLELNIFPQRIIVEGQNSSSFDNVMILVYMVLVNVTIIKNQLLPSRRN